MKKARKSVANTVTLACPFVMPDGDTCDADITLTVTPFYGGTRLDPPEHPQLEDLETTCGHALSDDTHEAALWQQLEDLDSGREEDDEPPGWDPYDAAWDRAERLVGRD